METDTTVVTTTRTRMARIPWLFVWEIYESNPCVSSRPDSISKSHEIYPLDHVWPTIYCRSLFQTASRMIMSCVCRTSWLKTSTSASPLSGKRRECCRNTGRNELLQLKTVPKINGHIFPPIWDVTNCSQRAQEKGRLLFWFRYTGITCWSFGCRKGHIKWELCFSVF